MLPQQQKIIEKMKSEKNSRTGIFEKAYNAKGAMCCIKAKCLDCCCFNVPEITNCQVFSCPLWAKRPYRVKNDEQE